MSYCSHCGSPNKASSKFCSNCGALLSAAFDVRCAICGTSSPIENTYCSTCGGRLEARSTLTAERADTIARIPTATLVPRPDEGQLAEVKEEPKGKAPPSDHERRGPDSPGWTKRLRSSSSSQPGTASAPTRDTEGVIPSWLSEIRGAAELADGNGGPGYESNEDWLARLREAAMVEQEPPKEEATATMEEAEPVPVPQWFAQIRPAILAKPTVPAPGEGLLEPSLREGVLEPAPAGTKQDERQQVGVHPTAPSLDGEDLPDWLVQLQSLPLPVEQEPPAAPSAEQSTTSAQAEKAISKGGEGPTEPAVASAEQAPEQGLAAAPQVANVPAESGLFEPPTAAPEQIVTSEIPLTREEELGLPDWLASPIEPGTLLPKIGETQESESGANSAILPERADAADTHRPASRLARITAGIQTWLRAPGQRLFPTRELKHPPVDTTFDESPDVEAEILANLTEQEPLRQASEEPAPAFGDDLPEWLTTLPEFEATMAPTFAPGPEQPEHKEFANPMREPSTEAGTESSLAEAEAPDLDGIATWPLPEDFTPDMPVVTDEILHPLVPGDSQVAQVNLESPAVQPTGEQDVTDPPIVENEILGLSIPAQPAAERSAIR